jgi:hypothetical protein
MTKINWVPIDIILAEGNLTYREVGERFGISHNTVKAHAHDEGMHRKMGRPAPHPWHGIDPVLAKVDRVMLKSIFAELLQKYPAIHPVTMKERYKTVKSGRVSSIKIPEEGENPQTRNLRCYMTNEQIEERNAAIRRKRFGKIHFDAVMHGHGPLSALSQIQRGMM